MIPRDPIGPNPALARMAIAVGLVVAAGSLVVHLPEDLGHGVESVVFGVLAALATWVVIGRHQRALGESEARYARLARNATDVIFRVRLRPVPCLEYASAAFERITGHAPEPYYTRPGLASILVHAADRAAVTAAIRDAGPEPFSLPPLRLAAREGGWVWMETRCVAVKDADDQVVAVEGIARDVTQTRAAEEALRASESRVRLLMDGLDAIFWEGVPDPPAFTFVSRGAEKKLGHPVERWLESFDFWKGLIHPADRDATVRACETAVREGRDHVLSYRMLAADGRVLWVEDFVRVDLDVSGRPVGYSGVIVDVTSRMRVQEDLKREVAVSAGLMELKRRLLSAPTADEVCRATLDHARALTGSPFGFVAPAEEDGSLLASAFTPAVTEGMGPPPGVLRMREPKGLLRLVRTAREPVLSNDVPGDPRSGAALPPGHAPVTRFLSVPALHGEELVAQIAVANAPEPYGPYHVAVLERLAPDVALALTRVRAQEEQQRLQQALLQAADEWRRTFDAMQTALLLVDGEGRIHRLNRAGAEAIGRDVADAVGRRLDEVAGHEPWRTALRLLAVEAPPPRTRVHDEEGARWWDVGVMRMPPGGEGERTIVGADDVTALVGLESSVRLSEKMAAMGALTAGVAHEVRNPLFAIAASVDALGAVLSDREDVSSLLRLMEEQVARLNQLMRDLLALGKPTKPELLADVPLGDVLAAAVKAVEPIGRKAGVALVRCGPEAGKVRGDAARLEEVFTNLLENAVQHSAAGSAVELRGAVVAAPGGDLVRCVVEDRGPGFRPADLARAFEPFFTRRSGGTGLGLSIAQRIAEQHGGRILLANREGGGGSVTVELPAV